MSTKRTKNYGLHAWDAGDVFLREEFNENFGVIDGALGAKCEVVVGEYSGPGDSAVRVELGRRPLAVHIEGANGYRHGSTTYGGLFFSQGQSSKVTLDDTGFTVKERYMLSNRVYVAYVEG
ncbi:MAG: hypothetical protein HFF07_05575 [Oscillospiraceae bacterium]|nr:hypothetical protein [Oscillospiraceae bacterium]